MTTITFAQLETEVRKLATENPDYIYPNYGRSARPGPVNVSGVCFYQTADKEECIFGRAFRVLNVTIPEAMERTSIGTVIRSLGIEVNSTQEIWATNVQGWQDANYSWSRAVAEADRIPGTLNTPYRVNPNYDASTDERVQ